MVFDLDLRTATLSVGEFAEFSVGPREAGGGAGGLWRAQLGTQWHRELRDRAVAEHGTAAEFELPLNGRIVHRGWTIALGGRVDQLLRLPAGNVLREIKTVIRPLPADESELRAEYDSYFIQAATYAALIRSGLIEGPAATAFGSAATATELVFVEPGSGLLQTVALTRHDEAPFRHRLEQVAEFLELRRRARDRLRSLRYRPPFAAPRPGQETTQAELTARFATRPVVFFEAPTGFGKTGVLLEFALGQLRSGHFDRALYLTSKATGQLQVIRTLEAMTAPDAAEANSAEPTSRLAGTTPVAAWHVRNKAEHCVNHVYHCVRDSCTFLAGAAERWAASGLARFYLDDRHARDLDTLRAAGRDARICPYEITRTALAFNDVWVGDYNYVFAPRNRGLFFEQPGFLPGRTLLLVDEAHNLPTRVADAYSHAFSAPAADAVLSELHRVRPPAALLRAWDHWTHFLRQRRPVDALPLGDEDDARHLLAQIASALGGATLDYAALGPQVADALWSVPALLEELRESVLPRLWWCPQPGELHLTCLDAAPAIASTLRDFGGVVLASATLSPIEGFAAACGLDSPPPAKPPAAPVSNAPERLGKLNKRDTRKLYRQLTSAAELLRVEETNDAAAPLHLPAHAPWRNDAYDLAVDARCDTTFQQRHRFHALTAATVAALQAAAGRAVAVFFPSYAYADAIAAELGRGPAALRVALQPKLRDLAAQSAWVEDSLRTADALFLVLGSSFAESIDALGGRISHAMVVGPALPEVNAVQRARLAEAGRAGLGREAAFRRVYQAPGMNKVNQALGRLVRAPGQRARVILHCRRFLEPTYAALLAPEYRSATELNDDLDLARWLNR